MINFFRKMAWAVGVLAPLVAAGLGSGRAEAGIITGTVYTNDPVDAQNASVKTPTSNNYNNSSTFTVNTNTAGANFRFDEPAGTNPDRIGTFLGSNGNTVTGLRVPVGNTTTQNAYFVFQETLNLGIGQYLFTINHDDGAQLKLPTSLTFVPGSVTGNNTGSDGVNTIGYILATSAGGNTGTQSGLVNVSTAGSYLFSFGYGEVNGLPATLEFTSTVVTPEPSTVLGAGTALLCTAGFAWRRRRRAVVQPA